MIGYCAITQESPPDSCKKTSGAWMGVRSLEECVSKCESCVWCNFVSFSQSAGECSYFAKCEIPLQRWHGGSAFRTVHVRKSVPFVNHSIHRPNAQDPGSLSRPEVRALKLQPNGPPEERVIKRQSQKAQNSSSGKLQ